MLKYGLKAFKPRVEATRSAQTKVNGVKNNSNTVNPLTLKPENGETKPTTTRENIMSGGTSLNLEISNTLPDNCLCGQTIGLGGVHKVTLIEIRYISHLKMLALVYRKVH
jgi:hypothetical protein